MNNQSAKALPPLRKDWRYHFLGIGGVGMSGIAEVLFRNGYQVSGSDAKSGNGVHRLTDMGIPVEIGHHPEALDGNDLIVYSSAIKPSHAIWKDVDKRGIQRAHRAELLGALTKEKNTIAVAGTHGKTTSSACLTHVLTHAGYDPTALIGGYVPQFDGGNIRIGQSPWLVIEADESDGSFVHFAPKTILVTNVEADHLDFHGSEEAVEQVFREFISGLPEGGQLVFCADDPGAVRAAQALEKHVNIISYGQVESAQVRFCVEGGNGEGMNVSIYENGTRHQFRSVLLGQHNAANLAGVYATARAVGIEPKVILEALQDFRGVARRQEFLGQVNNVLVFDDYAHHPTEVEATLGLFREFYQKPISVIFQPHLFSRTKAFAEKFAKALSIADRVYLVDIYPAREEQMPGVTSQIILDHLHQHPAASFLENWKECQHLLTQGEIEEGILILMGAGDITEAQEILFPKGQL